MKDFLSNLWKGVISNSAAHGPQVVHDSVLGEMRLVNDARWWEATTQVAGQIITFRIGGKGAPNAVSIIQAHEIVQKFETFQREINEFLYQQSVDYLSDGAEEIQQLEVESIHFSGSKQPRSGMIYFSGSDEYRLWHCDYIEGKFRSLVFDS